jgi:hypothetical protein
MQVIALLKNNERDCWFQQDGATCHTTHATMGMLEELFGPRIISKGLWPPRSPDLMPLDFYLWGFLKNIKDVMLEKVAWRQDTISTFIVKFFCIQSFY